MEQLGLGLLQETTPWWAIVGMKSYLVDHPRTILGFLSKRWNSSLLEKPTTQYSVPWRRYLETDPDPNAMVIRVELFTHKPSVTNAWLLMHVTSGYCMGLVDE